MFFALKIRRIKDDVEYYIESSQDPDFEENEYIYDDIIGLDDVVDLSGVGLPSSATTDSNETGGTPTSITSGTSPLPSSSPPHSVPLHNHSSDSSNECVDKKKKEDIPKVFSLDNVELLDQNEMTMMNHFLQPVKPTAVRATTNNLNNSTNSILNSSTTQASLNSSTGSTPGGKAPILVSSTPSKPVVSSTIIQPPIGAPAQVSCQSAIVSNNQPLASNSITTSSCSSNQSSQSSGGTSSGGSSASPAVSNHVGTGNFAAVAAANTHNSTNSKHNTNNSTNSSSNNSSCKFTSCNIIICMYLKDFFSFQLVIRRKMDPFLHHMSVRHHQRNNYSNKTTLTALYIITIHPRTYLVQIPNSRRFTTIQRSCILPPLFSRIIIKYVPFFPYLLYVFYIHLNLF